MSTAHTNYIEVDECSLPLLRSAVTITFSANSADTRYCTFNQHVRVSAGLFKPETCHCGAMRYVGHVCSCGNVHEPRNSQ